MALDDEAAAAPADPAIGAPGAGSGVFAKSRLRRYSSRGMGVSVPDASLIGPCACSPADKPTLVQPSPWAMRSDSPYVQG